MHFSKEKFGQFRKKQYLCSPFCAKRSEIPSTGGQDFVRNGYVKQFKTN